MKQHQKMLDYLVSSLKNDEEEVEKSKQEFVNFISNFKKEDLINKPTKLTIWQKIRKVLNF
jgi:hypothetical protein